MLILVKLYRYISLVMTTMFFIKNEDEKEQEFQGNLRVLIYLNFFLNFQAQ